MNQIPLVEELNQKIDEILHLIHIELDKFEPSIAIIRGLCTLKDHLQFLINDYNNNSKK